MIDQLSAIIGNGSGPWVWGYEPWLPFYDFFPLLFLASVILTCGLFLLTELSGTRALLWGSVLFTSGLLALAPVFVLWVKLDLNPAGVFYWWSINWILFIVGQAYFILITERVKEQIKAMEDREI